MFSFYGASRNLILKYNKFLSEENIKSEQHNESSILNKKFGSSSVIKKLIYILFL
jgi:hypothetical protein